MTVKLETMRVDPERVAALARRPGGVEVVRDDGTAAFRLVIPAAAIPTEHCRGCRCKPPDPAAAIAVSAELREATRGYRSTASRISYVLSLHPSVTFTPAQLIAVTGKSSEAVRTTLKRMARADLVQHVARARWQAPETKRKPVRK